MTPLVRRPQVRGGLLRRPRSENAAHQSASASDSAAALHDFMNSAIHEVRRQCDATPLVRRPQVRRGVVRRLRSENAAHQNASPSDPAGALHNFMNSAIHKFVNSAIDEVVKS